MDGALFPPVVWLTSKESPDSPEVRYPEASHGGYCSLPQTRSRILVIENDPQLAGLFGRVLMTQGHHAMSAHSASAAIAIASARAPDLLVLDLKLPDMSGLALLKLLRLRAVVCRVVVVSGFETEQVTDEERALGVVASIAKPICPSVLIASVTAALRFPLAVRPRMSPRDVAHRWAQLVLRGCEGDADIRTIDEWGHRAGVSAGTLREICRLVDVAPHDARDVARLLNALLKAHRHDMSVESMLNVGDRRTLDRLFAGAALEYRSRPPNVTAFLEGQRWIVAENAALQALRGIFSPSEVIAW